MVVKRGDRWCVVHAHPQKPGSKTDKPPGTVIKCYKFKKGDKESERRAKEKATRMHRAIMYSESQQAND
jgi:hypothetical protein